jgi:hypothetical protein
MDMNLSEMEFGDSDGVKIVSIDIEECRDLLMTCLMARMQRLGWTEGEAKQACDKACKKAAQVLPKCLERMALVCSNAACDGAGADTLRLLAMSEFAMGGVDIADDMNKSRIAARN